MFATKILDSMVDETGHCGERGLSEKQFDILSQYLKAGEEHLRGGWNGNYSGIDFYEVEYSGTIANYKVVLNDYLHFHHRYTVVSIDRWCDELPDTSKSTWKYEEGEKATEEVMLLSEKDLYNEWGTTYMYKMVDADGNLYVWFASNWQYVEVGDRFTITGKVKKNDEFRGVKQTVLTRCHIN